MGILPSVVSTMERSSTQTATANGTAIAAPHYTHGIVFILDVTAAATDGTDTLDVRIQTLLDGTNYLDIVRFPEVTGAASTVRHVDFVTPGLGEAAFDYSTTLAVSTQRNVISDTIRVSWTIVSGNSASFTFSVQVIPI